MSLIISIINDNFCHEMVDLIIESFHLDIYEHFQYQINIYDVLPVFRFFKSRII